jgi:hypothetical protein
MAVTAGLCWAGSIALLVFGNVGAERALFAPQRLIFYFLVVLAGLLTFLPCERWLAIEGLTMQGVGGTALLAYTLAFVPAPSEWLLYLPDMPVYALLLLGIWLSVAAVSLPFIVVLGQRFFAQRALAGDLRRSRRQSHELGLLAATTMALAGLRVLTWVSLLLLVLIIVIAELLFLSQVRAEVGG